jgi:hypothetical protein
MIKVILNDLNEVKARFYSQRKVVMNDEILQSGPHFNLCPAANMEKIHYICHATQPGLRHGGTIFTPFLYTLKTRTQNETIPQNMA